MAKSDNTLGAVTRYAGRTSTRGLITIGIEGAVTYGAGLAINMVTALTNDTTLGDAWNQYGPAIIDNLIVGSKAVGYVPLALSPVYFAFKGSKARWADCSEKARESYEITKEIKNLKAQEDVLNADFQNKQAQLTLAKVNRD